MDFKNHAGIDLHLHSTASDGTLTPAQLLTLALEAHIGAIAITDHDTIDGTKEALKSGIPSEIQFVTGVELSARPPASFDCPGSFHILGYGIDLSDPVLNQTLKDLQLARKNRNPRILERLKTLGLKITLDEVRQIAGGGQLGRPHIARAMIKKGYAESIDDAFDRYLGKGQTAYVDKYRLTCSQALELITQAKGLPVLAHPYLLEAESDKALDELVKTMTAMGLKGIEVYYPSHSAEQTALYQNLASRYGLVVTGGTDFHGKLKPDIQIGSGSGKFFVPYEIYEKLSRAITAV